MSSIVPPPPPPSLLLLILLLLLLSLSRGWREEKSGPRARIYSRVNWKRVARFRAINLVVRVSEDNGGGGGGGERASLEIVEGNNGLRPTSEN